VGLLARKLLLDMLGSSSSSTAATASISYMHTDGTKFALQERIFGWVSQSAHILAAIR